MATMMAMRFAPASLLGSPMPKVLSNAGVFTRPPYSIVRGIRPLPKINGLTINPLS